jgi:hypothetical protein
MLLPGLPKYLRLQAYTTMPSLIWEHFHSQKRLILNLHLSCWIQLEIIIILLFVYICLQRIVHLNVIIHVFLVFFPPIIMISKFIHITACTSTSFYCQINIPIMCDITHLSNHQIMNTWAIPTFWTITWIILFLCRCIF